MNGPNLVSYISHSDIEVVMNRVPPEHKQRFRDVFFSNDSRGVRRLGWTTKRGRRDVTLVAYLPPRVSLRSFIGSTESAAEFGAPTHGQWPPWAVRRFLLYDVLLHEIGHLQIIDSAARESRRKYADESKAQDFANRMRRDLYATYFDHSDPVHNPPTEAELNALRLWQGLDKLQRMKLVLFVLKFPNRALPDTSSLRDLCTG